MASFSLSTDFSAGSNYIARAETKEGYRKFGNLKKKIGMKAGETNLALDTPQLLLALELLVELAHARRAGARRRKRSLDVLFPLVALSGSTLRTGSVLQPLALVLGHPRLALVAGLF